MKVTKEVYNKLIDKSKQIKYDNQIFANLEEMAKYIQEKMIKERDKNEWGDNKSRNSKETSQSR